MTLRIDSHQHFWDRSKTEFDYSWQESAEMEPICRDFLPEHLQPSLKSQKFDYTVLVQTQHDVRENEWAFELADRNDFIAGVVGWVDLASPQCEQQLLDCLKHLKFAGIRHVVQDEPDNDFVVRPDVLKGLAILEKHQVPFDMLFYSKHLRHAPTIAAMFPDLPLVIDHLSKPQIRDGEINQWARSLKEAASFPNVYCKLSGLVTEADWKEWTVEQLRPYASIAINAFGANRMMFGSDWPVCTLAANYDQVVEVADLVLQELSLDEQRQVMGATARKFYSLHI